MNKILLYIGFCTPSFRGQHRVQGSLHPKQEGEDLKNLQEGVIHDERKNEFN